MKTYFYIVNGKTKNQLIGGHPYNSGDEAEAAIPKCNIPNDDAKIRSLDFAHLNEYHPVCRV